MVRSTSDGRDMSESSQLSGKRVAFLVAHDDLEAFNAELLEALG